MYIRATLSECKGLRPSSRLHMVPGTKCYQVGLTSLVGEGFIVRPKENVFFLY